MNDFCRNLQVVAGACNIHDKCGRQIRIYVVESVNTLWSQTPRFSRFSVILSAPLDSIAVVVVSVAGKLAGQRVEQTNAGSTIEDAGPRNAGPCRREIPRLHNEPVVSCVPQGVVVPTVLNTVCRNIHRAPCTRIRGQRHLEVTTNRQLHATARPDLCVPSARIVRIPDSEGHGSKIGHRPNTAQRHHRRSAPHVHANGDGD
mmetsp:Transcript_75822/g.197303  ORF Transcript_75822/g.197303 Transcript_75822/m.197303 type:complete len:202 (+) Transcript_75822:1159-1764(+)